MKRNTWRLLTILLVAGLVFGVLPQHDVSAAMLATYQRNYTERVTLASDGSQSTNWIDTPVVSETGRYVAFVGGDNTIVEGDDNGQMDVFVKDRQTGAIMIASSAADGTIGAGGDSGSIDISGNGSYVVFNSGATNLVPNDTNGLIDVFMKDISTGAVTLVSTSLDETQGSSLSTKPSVSYDGSLVAFQTSASQMLPSAYNGYIQVYVKNVETGEVTAVSTTSGGDPGNGDSKEPAISSTGRYVAFTSGASNLVSGDDNGQDDIFVKDLDTENIVRVSVATDGTQSDLYSMEPSMSSSRFVVFTSMATNLVAGDTNGTKDVFLHDLDLGTTIRLSVKENGDEVSEYSQSAVINDDGRYVVFFSGGGLVDGDNAGFDVYVYDIEDGSLMLASRNSAGEKGYGNSTYADISGDGTVVVFKSETSNLVSDDTNGTSDVFATYQAAAPAAPTLSGPTDSATLDDVRPTFAWNEVGEYYPTYTLQYSLDDDTFGAPVEVTTTLLAHTPAYLDPGTYFWRVQASKDGQTSAWSEVWSFTVSDPGTDGYNNTERISVSSEGVGGTGDSAWTQSPMTSTDGRYVVFSGGDNSIAPGDVNGFTDVLMKDRETGTVQVVSTAQDGTRGSGDSINGVVTADGSLVAFHSAANNLTSEDTNSNADVFLKMVSSGDIYILSTTEENVISNGRSYDPRITPDGSLVAFYSNASNLVPESYNGYYQVYVKNTITWEIEMVSSSSGGASGIGESTNPDISGNGRYVAFESAAANLVSGDTNGMVDIFVKDLANGAIERVSVATDGSEGDQNSERAAISADGRYVVFTSYATNFKAGDDNGHRDVFLHDRQTGTTTCISVNESGNVTAAYSQSAQISDDGRFAVFFSGGELVSGDYAGFDIYLYDTQNDRNTLVSINSAGEKAIGNSTYPDISGDGRVIVFGSGATNLSDIEDTNGFDDIFALPYVDAPPLPPVLTAPADGAALSEKMPTFDWGDISDATGYTLQYDTDAGFTSPVEETTTASSFTPASDLADGNYYWRVKSMTATKESGWGEEWTFAVMGQSTPTFPKNNYEITAGITTLKWSEASDALRYLVELYDPNNDLYDTFLVATGACDAGECSYKLPYTLETEYGSWQWRVKGVYAGDAGEWSTAAVFDYVQLTPIGVQTPADNAVLDTAKPTFTWGASAQNVFAYDLEVWAVDGTLAIEKNFKPVDVCGVDTCSWTATEDLADGTYTWRVLAKKYPNNAGWTEGEVFTIGAGGGASAWTGLETGTAFSAPQPRFPKNEYVITVGTSLIKWASVSGASSYVLELYRPSGEWFDAWEVASSACGAGLCEFKLPYTLETEFGSWQWRVRAKDGEDVGEWSGYATFVYEKLSSLTLTSPLDAAVATTTPTFTWEDSTQTMFKYAIEIWSADGTLLVEEVLDPGDICSAGTCSWTSTTALTAGEEYKWRVLGKKWPNTTGWTEMETFSITD